MRALFVSPHFPQDLKVHTYGVYKRLDLFVSALAGMCDSLELLFYVPHDYDVSPENVARLRAIYSANWNKDVDVRLERIVPPLDAASAFDFYLAPIFDLRRQRSYSYASGASQAAAFRECLDRRPDMIFVHRLYGMMPIFDAKQPLPPVFLDLDEVEHRWFFNHIPQPPHWRMKPLLYLQVPAIYFGERKALRIARKSFVCSTADRDYLSRLWNLDNVVKAQNALRVPDRVDPLTCEKSVLFLGSYAYNPNVAAASMLIDEIWPIVRQHVPDATLLIAGDRPENIPAFRAAPKNVEFTGFVPDIDQLYKRIRVVACPIRSGGGTRLKLIEAALYGKAIVSTTIGAEGLELEDNVDALIRDDVDGFAKACVALLEKSDPADRLAGNARRNAVVRYNKDEIVREVQKEIRESLAKI